MQLNQLLLTANKPLDPKNSDYQWGFKVQFMYGSDARYTQFLGELNRVDPDQRYQLDVVEANVLAHLPWLTEGGIDLKVGQYSTPLGYETIDPSTNPFYSHSYIFQFGLPFKHTGALTTTHVNSMLDVYAGIDTGTNTTFGPLGDNNSAVGGIGGFNLNFMDGKLTILALTHFGPEQATRVLSPHRVQCQRLLALLQRRAGHLEGHRDLTLVTEANWVRDGFGSVVNPGKAVNGFGVAQYASYALTETLSLNGQGRTLARRQQLLRRLVPRQQFLRQVPAGPVDTVRPRSTRHQHDLRRADPRRDLEAGDAGTGDRRCWSDRKSAGITPSPTTSRSTPNRTTTRSPSVPMPC